MSDPTGSQLLPPAPGGAWEAIARCVRALLPPSPALYCECNQERLREHWGRLAALDAALEDLRKRGFAAATRLMSLDPPPQASGHAEFPPAINGGHAP